MQRRIDWKRPELVAIIFAFFAGLTAHMFGLVNVLHNGDDILVQPIGYGNGLDAGRFFLQIFGDWCQELFGGYNLPWFNGVLFIALIAIAAGIVISILDIKNPINAAVIGIIFVTFPSVTATMDYRFTVAYYGVAIVLSVMAAWFLVKCKFGIFPSAVCSALSLGIYQAYLPLAVSVLVLYILIQVLQEKTEFWYAIIKGVYFCFAIFLGFLLYKLLLNACLKYENITLSGYQSINEMGKISIAEIPKLLIKTISAFCRLPVDDYVMLAQTKLLKIAYACVYVVTLLIIVFVVMVRKLRADKILLTLFLVAVLPVAINLIMIMCPDSYIHCLMVYGFVMTPCLPIILVETFPVLDGLKEKLRRFTRILSICAIATILCCNIYMANVNYSAAYYANRQTENYISSIITQIRMTEGFSTEKKWAVIGSINDPLLVNSWQKVPVYMKTTTDSSYLTRSWYAWMVTHYGYSPQIASGEEVSRLEIVEDVKSMPYWPSEGSIKVIDEYVVIKFGNS